MNAAQTYTKVQHETLSGREIEARALRRAADQLRAAGALPEGPERLQRLQAAIRFNLRVWDVFHADWDREDSTLPPDLRTDLLRLSVYVHRTSLAAQAFERAGAITSLADINDCLAAGLMTAVAVKEPVPATAG